jgi:antitoxin component HigA of HigAB toxin-antitoxin module
MPDAKDAIKFRLEQRCQDRKALLGIVGKRKRVYEVLRRDRALSLAMIRRLNRQVRDIGRGSHSAGPHPKEKASSLSAPVE